MVQSARILGLGQNRNHIFASIGSDPQGGSTHNHISCLNQLGFSGWVKTATTDFASVGSDPQVVFRRGLATFEPASGCPPRRVVLYSCCPARGGTPGQGPVPMPGPGLSPQGGAPREVVV